VSERVRVRRIAIRQLERADLYLGAVAGLNMSDDEAVGAIDRIREDVETLRRRLLDR
jgi:hypothetical protein